MKSIRKETILHRLTFEDTIRVHAVLCRYANAAMEAVGVTNIYGDSASVSSHGKLENSF